MMKVWLLVGLRIGFVLRKRIIPSLGTAPGFAPLSESQLSS